MAHVTVRRRATAVSSTTNATSWTGVTFTWTTNTAISAGNTVRWYLFVSADGNPTITETSGGWTKIGQTSDATNAVTGAWFYLDTTSAFAASASPSFTVSSTASEQYSAILYAVEAGAGFNLAQIDGTAAQGSSTNSNPPAITNSSGASQDITVFAVRHGDSTVVATAAPTNYTTNHLSRAGGGTNGASINSGDRQLTVANSTSEDPGVFTSATEQWVSETIGVYQIAPTPTITSSNSASVAENSVLSKSLTADITVAWSLVGGADQARFEISGSTLRWLSNGTKDYETPNDADTNNTYIVTVRATGTAGGTADQTITVTVTNSGPIITSSSSPSVNENSVLAHSLTNLGGTATWSIVGGADSSLFEISGSTLRWLSNGTKDFESPNDSGTNNIYNVTVRATVSGESIDQAVSVTVTNLSQPSATAWLSGGGELLVNGVFGLGTDPWTPMLGASISNVSGEGRVTPTDFGDAIVYQSFTTVNGANYQVLYDINPANNPLYGGSVYIGTSAGSSNLALDGPTTINLEGRTFSFTATGSTTFISIVYHFGDGSGIYVAFDNLSVVENISGDPSIADNAAATTHVRNTNKSYHASNFSIVGGTNSGQFELYNNGGTLAVRTASTPLTAGTSTVQIRDLTNGPAGSAEARTDTLSITVTSSATYVYVGTGNRASHYKGNQSAPAPYVGAKTGLYPS